MQTPRSHQSAIYPICQSHPAQLPRSSDPVGCLELLLLGISLLYTWLLYTGYLLEVVCISKKRKKNRRHLTIPSTLSRQRSWKTEVSQVIVSYTYVKKVPLSLFGCVNPKSIPCFFYGVSRRDDRGERKMAFPEEVYRAQNTDMGMGTQGGSNFLALRSTKGVYIQGRRGKGQAGARREEN